MDTNITQNICTYRFLAEDIANLFYTKEESSKQEGSLGSINYWNHVHAIEDIVTHFVQSNDLTPDHSR